MSLADFYEHNTLLSQLDFLGIASMKELPSISTGTVLVEKDTNLQPKSSDFEVLVDDNIVLPKVDFIKSNQRKNAVFLTGATGFFGAHLVKALLEAGYEKIFCLVRGENPSRLYDTLSWYFGNGWTHFNQMKIKAIQGDLLQQNFGIAGHIADQMILQIGYVIHAGADVRHYATDNLAEKTNREGTANAIQLAKKAQAKLIHISTVSLCAEYIINSPEKVTNFSETDFEIGQNWDDNVYLRGKFAAEELVRQAVNDDSVSATILRIGRLVGRSSDGVFQKNASTNAFWGLVNGISCLTKISKELSQFPLEMTAVDECAQAAVLLMNSHQLVYHLFNPHLLTVKEIFTLLDRPIVEVNKEQFEQHLREQSQSKNAARIAPLLSQYYHLMQVPFRITPICDLTTSELSKYRFVWKKNDPKILLHSFFENDGKETFAY